MLMDGFVVVTIRRVVSPIYTIRMIRLPEHVTLHYEVVTDCPVK